MTTTAVQINTRTEDSPAGVKKKTTSTSKDKKVQNFPKLGKVVTTLTEVTKTIDIDTTTIVKRTTTVTEVTTKDTAAGAKLVKGCEGTGWTSPDDLSFTRKVARCKPGFPAPKPLATKEKVKVSSSFKLEFNSPLLLAISLGEFAKENIEAYKQALARRGAPEVVKPEFSGGAAIGALRQIVVAETDEEAMRIAAPAALKHHEEINWLRTKHGVTEHTSRLNVPRAHSAEGMIKEGTLIAGSPKTVLAEIERQAETMGTNYVLAYMMFGNMKLDDAMRSLNLFHTEVMPAVARM